ncbi:MAG: type II toxin-antitoxin system VapC family toxin [Bryobacteraceae bacterium]
MACGLDTPFLVQFEVAEADGHIAARRWVRHATANGQSLALAPQVLAEFIHIVTDPARFRHPLSAAAAVARALSWWTAAEIQPVHITDAALRLFAGWMTQHRLGRRRILDTLLAATYWANGVTEIVTSDARDFRLYGCFAIRTP